MQTIKDLKYVSFYSIDTIYEKLYHTHLLPTLKLWNLPYWVKRIKNLGSWADNTCQKPAIILEALNKYPKHNIVWIDTDAKIKDYPLFLGILNLYDNCDIAVHYLNWFSHYGRPSDKGKTELVDGTIYIRNNKKMREFIKEWKQNSTDKNINHQKVLEKMLEKRKDIKVYNLPREYCYITTTSSGKKPAIPLKEPIICHYQASRKAKKGLK